MKIYSQFRDSYDNCAMYGVDEDTIYRRFFATESRLMQGEYAFMKPWVSSAHRQVSARFGCKYRERSECPELEAMLSKVQLMFLVVGRHVIPHFGVLEVRRFISHLNSHAMHLLGYGSTKHLALTHPDDIQSALGKVYTTPQAVLDGLFERYEPLGYRKAFRDHMDAQMQQRPVSLLSRTTLKSMDELTTPFEDERWAATLGTPLAVIMPAVVPVMERRGRSGSGETDKLGALILHNPSVNNLALASLMDPFQIHQAIMMALNSFLSEQHDGPMAISDTDMAHAKGFDVRSFRTPKGAKKPRRKRRDMTD